MPSASSETAVRIVTALRSGTALMTGIYRLRPLLYSALEEAPRVFANPGEHCDLRGYAEAHNRFGRSSIGSVSAGLVRVGMRRRLPASVLNFANGCRSA